MSMKILRKSTLALAIFVYCTSAIASNEYDSMYRECDLGFNNPLNSIPACSKIIKDKPPGANLANAFINRGSGWRSRKNFDEAIKDFSSAIDLDPASDSAFGERGLAWRERGDTANSLSDLSQAIAINKQNANWFYWRALVYVYMSDPDKALSDLDKSLEINKSFWNAYLLRSIVNYGNHNFDSALKDIGYAIDNNPNQGLYLLQRARFRRDRGEYTLAMEDLNLSAKINPLDTTTLVMKADTLRRMKRYKDSQLEINAVLKHEPDNCDALVVQARILHSTSRENEAISKLSKCLSLNPAHIEALMWRSRFYLEKRNLTQAWSDVIKVDRILPKTPMILTLKAEIESANGQIDQAKETLKSASLIDRDYIAADLALAQIEIKDNNFNAAIKVLTSLLSTQPKSNFEELNGVKDRAEELLSEARAIIKRNSASDERRIALVIGNDKYENVTQLISADYDAREVADKLTKLGFQVFSEYDATLENTTAIVEKFEGAAKNADWALIYYAGHGIEINGTNYIIPVDANLRVDTDVAKEAMPIGRLLRAAAGAKKLRFIVLDACRNNPFTHKMTRQISRYDSDEGLGRIEPDFGTLVFLAAKQGEVAHDAPSVGLHSPFSQAFIRRMSEKDLEIRKFIGVVTDDVLAATANEQRPYVFGSLSGRLEYYFK